MSSLLTATLVVNSNTFIKQTGEGNLKMLLSNNDSMGREKIQLISDFNNIKHHLLTQLFGNSQ